VIGLEGTGGRSIAPSLGPAERLMKSVKTGSLVAARRSAIKARQIND
jgi:hypothetical protein